MIYRSRVVEDRPSVTTYSMMVSPRSVRFRPGVLGNLYVFYVLALVALSLPPSAFAQGRLEARYEATLAGVPVGKGAWNIDIADDSFSASAFGGTAGLLKAFASGSGTGAAQGRVVNGALVSSNYSASTTTSKKTEAIRMLLANGTIKEYAIEPEPPVDPDRIPVTEAHRKGVFDPMTGAMLRVPGTSDPLGPDACRTGTAIFDGRMRYDLKLDFK